MNNQEWYLKFYNSWGANRWFCWNCSSSFCFKYSEEWWRKDYQDYIHFARANISTDLPIEPKEHIYYESHAKWFPFTDELHKVDNSEHEKNS